MTSNSWQPPKDVPRVLVGVDGSADGLRAVRYGARSALASQGVLHLVHAVDDAVLAGAWGVVYDPGALVESGRSIVEEAEQAAVAEGLPADQVHSEVLLGNGAAVLSRLAEGASLVVVGRRSVGGLERMFIGSTSVAVAENAPCPVVVISAAASPGTTGGRGVVAVGLGPQSHASSALQWAFDEASRRGARLRVVRVDAEGAAGADLAATRIEEELAPLRESHPGLDVSVELTRGNPVDRLVAVSGEADLLVIGVPRPRVLGLHMGGVMRGVLAHAQCPMALLKPGM